MFNYKDYNLVYVPAAVVPEGIAAIRINNTVFIPPCRMQSDSISIGLGYITPQVFVSTHIHTVNWPYSQVLFDSVYDIRDLTVSDIVISDSYTPDPTIQYLQDITVLSGGSLYLRGSGCCSLRLETGGYTSVLQDTILQHTYIASSACLQGQDFQSVDTKVYGSMHCGAQCSITCVQVKRGGQMFLQGYAQYVSVFPGGSLSIGSGGRAEHITVHSQGNLSVSDASHVLSVFFTSGAALSTKVFTSNTYLQTLV